MERKQRRVWTEDKAKELIEYFNVHTKEETAEKFGFSDLRTCGEMVRILSKKYNISRNNQRRYLWTEDNAKELIEYYNNHTVEETAEKFGFSADSVQPTISRLRKRFGIPKERKLKWDEEKAREFVNFYATHTAKETAEKYEFSSINSLYHALNIVSVRYNIPRDRKKNYRRWTEEKAHELMEFHLSHSTEETMKRYDFSSKNSISDTLSRLSKRYNISMERKTVKCKWTKEKAKELIEFHLSHSTEETMKKYNFSRRNSVYRVINRLSKRYNIARE